MLRLASLVSTSKNKAVGTLVGAGLMAATLIGCDPIDLDNRTPGNEGQLAFSYGSEAFLSCLFGCAIDRPVMTHTSVTIIVGDADPNVVLTARTSSPNAKVDSFDALIQCTSEDAEGTHDRDVTHDEKCAANEERSIIWSAHVSASKEEVFDVEILQDGDLLDSLTLSARDAATSTLHHGSSEEPIGSLVVPVGETRVVTASFFDVDGTELATGVTGSDWKFADESIAKRGSPFAILFGPWNALVVEGAAPGSTTVLLDLGELEVLLPVEVK